MTEKESYILYKGVYLPKMLHDLESLEYYEDFSFRPDDVLIVTYPKSGTTWMQEIVPLIQAEGDPAAVQSLTNWTRAPWLEQIFSRTLNLEQRPSPRFLTTHHHYSMMPPSFFKARPKVIYAMRNPKDVFTSFFHFQAMASIYTDPETPSKFLRKFLDGNVAYGSWFDHIRGWLKAEEKERIMFLSFEERIMDLKSALTRVAQFMDKSLDSEVIEKIADQCVFKNMKKNEMSNYSKVPEELFDQRKSEFFRKGIIGDWKNLLTTAESEYFDSVYKVKMKDVAVTFVWE